MPSRFNWPGTHQICARTRGSGPSVASSRISRRGRSADRRHLLLPARGQRGHGVAPLAQPREQGKDTVLRPDGAHYTARGRRCDEIFVHRQPGKYLPSLRHQTQSVASDPIGRQSARHTPSKCTCPVDTHHRGDGGAATPLRPSNSKLRQPAPTGRRRTAPVHPHTRLPGRALQSCGNLPAGQDATAAASECTTIRVVTKYFK